MRPHRTTRLFAISFAAFATACRCPAPAPKTADAASPVSTPAGEPSPPPPEEPAGAPEDPARANAAEEQAHLELTDFDCIAEGHDDANPLRRWHNGGPHGAGFNWYQHPLVCTLRLTTPCPANVVVDLHVGESRRSTERLVLESGVAHPVRFVVGADVWESALREAEHGLYETLFVAIEVDGRCTDQNTHVHASDSFVGGFSGGE